MADQSRTTPKGLPHVWVSHSVAVSWAYCRLCDCPALFRSLHDDCPNRESDEQFMQRARQSYGQ